jgi:hypothetical protein
MGAPSPTLSPPRDLQINLYSHVQINILHIHRPDPQTPLEEQASSLDAMYRDGKFAAVSPFIPSGRLSVKVNLVFVARSLELLT